MEGLASVSSLQMGHKGQKHGREGARNASGLRFHIEMASSQKAWQSHIQK